MVQFLQEQRQPGFGETIGNDIGQGFGGGFEKGMGQAIENFFAQKKQKQVAHSKLTSTLGRDLKLIKADLDPDVITKIRKNAATLIDQGFDASAASQLAIEHHQTEENEKNPVNSDDQLSFTQRTRKGLFDDVKRAGAFTAGAATSALELPLVLANKAGELGRAGVAKLAGMTPEQIQSRETKLQEDTRAGEKATGILNPMAPGGTSFEQGISEKTGGLSDPRNNVEKVIHASFKGLPGALAELGRQFLEGVGAPESVQTAAEVVGFIVAAKEGASFGPKTRTQAINRVVSKAETVAKETGKPLESVLQEAQVKSGASFEKAVGGDVKEINKLKNAITKEAPKSANKVVQAEKGVFNKEAALKERGKFAEKVVESPLEEHFKPEKTVKKQAATMAKEETRAKELTPKIEKAEIQLKEVRDRVHTAKENVAKAKAEDIPQRKAELEVQRHRVQVAEQELKDLKYELREGRLRETPEQIEKRIKEAKSFYEKEAKKPTSEGQKKIARDLDLDKKYLERAEKIASRGELPGKEAVDTYIDINKKYLDGYRAMLSEQKELAKGLKSAPSKANAPKLEKTQRLVKYLEDRIKRLESNLTNHTDKLKAKEGLNKPSGAFYRNALKQLRKDVEAFKQDQFRHVKNIKSPEVRKTEAVASKALKENKVTPQEIKKGEDLAKNPTKEKLEEVAPGQGEKLGESIKKEKAAAKESAKKIENGTDTKSDQNALTRWMVRVAKLGGGGLAAGALQAGIEQETGVKLPVGVVKFMTGLNYTTLGTTKWGYDAVSYFYDYSHVENILKRRNNPQAKQEYVNGLKKRYDKRIVNRILRKVKEEREDLS